MKNIPLIIKEFPNKKLRQILKKRLYYLPLVYILVNTGFILALFYPKELYLNISLNTILLMLLPFSCFFLQRIYVKFFQNKDDNFNEKFLKIYFIIGYSMMIFLPLLISFNIFSCFKYNLTLYYFIILILLSFVSSLIFNGQLKYRLLIEYNENINEIILTFLLFFGTLILVFIMHSPRIIISFTNIFILKLSAIGTLTNIAIAIVVLCATLSALSFTYCSLLKDNGNYIVMKKNGERYFISTILSMSLFLFIYIYSLISSTINLTKLFGLNLIEYILINSYAISLIFLVTLLVYIVYYIVIPSFSTLKILGFFK